MAVERRAIIFVNGELPAPEKLGALLKPNDWLVAADGGLRHIKKLGLEPELLIGDLDSVLPGEAELLLAEGVRIEHFPVDKDETDLELAVKAVLDMGFKTILIAGALGGRIDHALGNIFLLINPEYKDCDIRLENGLEQVFVIRQEAVIEGAPGDIISLLPLVGRVEGVCTEGLRYPLNHETLLQGQTRGISNIMLAYRARVSLDRGLLLCIHSRK